MSQTSQTGQNGKKSNGSSNANTPASTPITNGQVNSQSSPPPNNNAPKYGTLVPNRIFVGGISASTTEGELLALFSNYGIVKAAKIIQDRAGVSKGYGFITFESEDDARRPLRDADNIVLRERKLNIAPAIKKQPFSRAFDASSPPAVAPGNPAQFFFPPGTPVPYFQGGVAYYPQPATGPQPGDAAAAAAAAAAQQSAAVYQPPPVYPAQTGPPQTATYPSMMFPAQTIYMPQQYHMPMPQYDYNYYPAGNGTVAPHHQYQSGAGGPPCQPPPSAGGLQQQSGNSPPRPPCYGGGGGSQQQQAPPPPMQAYADGGVYYNLSVYGASAAMDAPAALFSEAFDMTAAAGAGPYGPEDYQQSSHLPQLHHMHQGFEFESAANAAHVLGAIESLEAPPSAVGVANEEGAAAAAPIAPEEKKRGDTPVVSLLSLDQHQEKDISSMQGGRRRKSVTPQQPQHHHHHLHQAQSQAAPSHHGYHHTATNGFYHHQQHQYYYPAFNSFGPPPHHQPHHQPHHHHNYQETQFRFGGGNNTNRSTMVNGHGGRKQRGARSSAAPGEQCSSRSSLRTDSNSSASVAGDDGRCIASVPQMTGVMTPPPTAYSPIANRLATGTVSRNYANTMRHRPHNRAQQKKTETNNNDDFQVMHAGGGYGQPQPPQGGRRSRRSIRRTMTNATQSEIGQGDGPVKTTATTTAPEDVAAKKLENLKL